MYSVSSSPYCGMNPSRGKNQAILLHNNTRPIFIRDSFAPYKRKMIKSYQRVTPFALFFFLFKCLPIRRVVPKLWRSYIERTLILTSVRLRSGFMWQKIYDHWSHATGCWTMQIDGASCWQSLGTNVERFTLPLNIARRLGTSNIRQNLFSFSFEFYVSLNLAGRQE